MKLQFKHQPYQLEAVQSVVDCFRGQPFRAMHAYRNAGEFHQAGLFYDGYKNAELILDDAALLNNLHAVQKAQNLPLSEKLVRSHISPLNLDVEMETGTGKTYCYIRTIFELNKQYGWSKFIIVVPSIAIREGVKKSFEVTAEHFQQDYGRKADCFIYNSKQIQQLNAFSSSSHINVMIINIQAFNAKGKDNLRIYQALDEFQSQKPIDVIAQTRPILILDEPQKMEGAKTLDSLKNFKPLMMLRYSATHKTQHNKIHRLDAIDAYNKKLVKEIAVQGISIKGVGGMSAYCYLQSIEISKSAPVAWLEIERKAASGQISKKLCKIQKGDDLQAKSGLAQYAHFVVSEISAVKNQVSFTNGIEISVGDAMGDIGESHLRRIQIRETIRAHFAKERQLFGLGIKVLSLFFIDEVAKYRDYTQADEKGEYARLFEEEYRTALADQLNEPYLNPDYRAYLEQISTERTHNGYFSIDKKTKRLTDPAVKTRGENAGVSDDVDAYDLILKDKEKLLSFAEPTRFIFSHSALREGWDNPNVFVICMLKHSDNQISHRQEVGRGLRLAVNQQGERQDDPKNVHQINQLLVVANESYKTFAEGLQKEIADSSPRAIKIDREFFVGKVLKNAQSAVEIDESFANSIHRWLLKQDYTDDNDQLTAAFHTAVQQGILAEMPEKLQPYQAEILALIAQNGQADYRLQNARTRQSLHRNANFDKQAFQSLWAKINRKAVYFVDFDSLELIQNAVATLDRDLSVSQILYTSEKGRMKAGINAESLKNQRAFQHEVQETQAVYALQNPVSSVQYDLLGVIAKQTGLTRKTIAEILQQVRPETFAKFRQNPEEFISEASRLINEQKATLFVERLSYNLLDDSFSSEIFAEQTQNIAQLVPVQKHIYDFIAVDSATEKRFAQDLDVDSDVTVYAKLPRGFAIPTPVGDYNPDWAISFKEGTVKHIYFVAETKGSMSSLQLRGSEAIKIDCARKFFEKLNSDQVQYDVVTDYAKLMQIVKG